MIMKAKCDSSGVVSVNPIIIVVAPFSLAFCVFILLLLYKTKLILALLLYFIIFYIAIGIGHPFTAIFSYFVRAETCLLLLVFSLFFPESELLELKILRYWQ